MSPGLSNNILIALIIFFGIFVFSGLLKYIGVREGMTGENAQNVVTGTPVNVTQFYPSF